MTIGLASQLAPAPAFAKMKFSAISSALFASRPVVLVRLLLLEDSLTLPDGVVMVDELLTKEPWLLLVTTGGKWPDELVLK